MFVPLAFLGIILSRLGFSKARFRSKVLAGERLPDIGRGVDVVESVNDGVKPPVFSPFEVDIVIVGSD